MGARQKGHVGALAAGVASVSCTAQLPHMACLQPAAHTPAQFTKQISQSSRSSRRPSERRSSCERDWRRGVVCSCQQLLLSQRSTTALGPCSCGGSCRRLHAEAGEVARACSCSSRWPRSAVQASIARLGMPLRPWRAQCLGQ